MFSNFLIYPSCHFRFAFVCADHRSTPGIEKTSQIWKALKWNSMLSPPVRISGFQDVHSTRICICMILCNWVLYLRGRLYWYMWLRVFQWHFLLSRWVTDKTHHSPASPLFLAIFVALMIWFICLYCSLSVRLSTNYWFGFQPPKSLN